MIRKFLFILIVVLFSCTEPQYRVEEVTNGEQTIYQVMEKDSVLKEFYNKEKAIEFFDSVSVIK